MTATTRKPAAAAPGAAASAAIPRRALVVGTGLGAKLDAASVLGAIALGVEQGGWPPADVCALPASSQRDPAATLEGLDFDVRMRAARAVVIVAARLQERTLAGSVTFEIATRARQGGVPAYAVTAKNRLQAFDARILDLQAIVEATDKRALTAAGRKLAGLL